MKKSIAVSLVILGSLVGCEEKKEDEAPPATTDKEEQERISSQPNSHPVVYPWWMFWKSNLTPSTGARRGGFGTKGTKSPAS